MNEDIGCFLLFVAFIVVLFIGAWFFNLVWNSGLPMWLKWFILR